MNFVYANFVANGCINNSWFNSSARDDCTRPFIKLRDAFRNKGIILNSPDINFGYEIDFEIHIDIQRLITNKKTYLFLWETNDINSNNEKLEMLENYRKIFTWDDEKVNCQKFIKYYLPVADRAFNNQLGWSQRPNFCCSIASNKYVTNKNSKFELYSKRTEIFDWFQINHPEIFNLYGSGWNVSKYDNVMKFLASKVNLIPKFYFNKYDFYKGEIVSKNEILAAHKYAICFENVSNLKGYVTEKIFDCFFSGTIPVYYGAENISDYVPKECYIDYREFSSHDAMLSKMNNIKEDEYINRQLAIKSFLDSESFSKFRACSFADHVSQFIHQDAFLLSY